MMQAICADVVHQMALVTNHQSSEVAQPSEQALDLPAPLAMLQLAILGAWHAPVAPVGRDPLDPAFRQGTQNCLQHLWPYPALEATMASLVRGSLRQVFLHSISAVSLGFAR